jgi:hypothetical protein
MAEASTRIFVSVAAVIIERLSNDAGLLKRSPHCGRTDPGTPACDPPRSLKVICHTHAFTIGRRQDSCILFHNENWDVMFQAEMMRSPELHVWGYQQINLVDPQGVPIPLQST